MVKEKPSAPTRAPQGFRQMSNNDPASDPDEPKVSASAIVCEFPTVPSSEKWIASFFGKSKMILDPEAGVIYFKKCFVPYGFLTRKIRGWYACELSDIQSIVLAAPMRGKGDYSTTHEYLMTHGEWGICIDTVYGKVEYIPCMMNDETWRVGKYLEEYIRCQEKESPLSRLKTTSADFLTWADVRTGNFAPFVKMFFFAFMSIYGMVLPSRWSTDNSGLSLTVFGLLGGFIGWFVGLLIYYFLLNLLPKNITKSPVKLSCLLLLIALGPPLFYLMLPMATEIATEVYVMLISPLIVTPEDQVFWFSVIGVAGLIVALGCGVLIRTISRYRRAVTESLQAGEMSGLENQQPDKKPDELLADISSSAMENTSGEWSEKE